MIRRLFSFFRRADLAVSPSWLKAYARSQSRIEFHSAAWKFPVNKLANDTPRRLRMLRRSA